MEQHTGHSRRIAMLDSAVIDQIAAGEVVERPQHLVKELVENAIDAKATEVIVEYSQGGRYVAVADNGVGIHPEDLRLALGRHATSKISNADDLWALNTFGFRGEALSAIAAVSRLQITSCRADSHEAFSVESEFGRLSGPNPSAGNPGTRVEVRDLFESVPARLKFLKSEVGEQSAIRQVVKALSMVHPNVAFRLRDATQAQFDLALESGQSFVERCQAVLNVPLYEAVGTENGVKVHAAFSSPDHVVKQNRQIWIFVQGRWVQDRSIQAAVLESYRSLLMHGEYPVVAIQLELDPSLVDVNIHPTKSQVKFQNPSDVFRAVSRVLRAAIEKAPWRVLDLPRTSESEPKTDSPHDRIKTAVQNYSQQDEFDRTSTDRPRWQIPAAKEVPTGRPGYVLEDFVRPYGAAGSQLTRENNGPRFAQGQTYRYQDLKLIGQVHLTYLICEWQDQLVLIDQHAAHERIAFERLMAGFRGSDEKPLEAQDMLFPRLLEMDAELIEAVVRSKSQLERLGISVDTYGPRTLAITRIPTLLKVEVLDVALEKFARACVDHGGSHLLELQIQDVVATLACHSVVRAGDRMEREEMLALLKQMDEFPLSGYCPHGRPVAIEIPFSRIERDFGRLGS